MKKTCENCIFWHKIGRTAAQKRLVYDSRVVMVEAGDEGVCRSGPPQADNRWPLTMAGDWCGQCRTREDITLEPREVAGAPRAPVTDTAEGAAVPVKGKGQAARGSNSSKKGGKR